MVQDNLSSMDNIHTDVIYVRDHYNEQEYKHHNRRIVNIHYAKLFN
jgi:hypothetical protein